MKLDNLNLVELDAQEVKSVEGGLVPVDPVIGFASFVVGAFAFAYSIGKDRAEADRR